MHRATRRGTGRFTLEFAAFICRGLAQRNGDEAWIALHYVEHELLKLKVDTAAASKNL
jgi:hypothetical protein